MKKIIFLLFICFIVNNFAFAQWCNDDCSHSCPSGSGDDIAFNKINKKTICKDKTTTCTNNLIICNNDLTNFGFGNARIGWAKNCAIPAGELSPSQYSCMSTGNVMGQVLDTFLTIGIAVQMRKNFCSFSPGNQELEGAIINRRLLSSCNKSPYNTPGLQHDCISCILKGKQPNPPWSSTKCNYPLDDSSSLPADPLGIDSYTKNTSICDGIPNLEKPILDDSTNKQVYVDDKGNRVSTNNPNRKTVYCPILRCNIPTNHIRAKYFDAYGPRTLIMTFLGSPIAGFISLLTGDCCDITTLENNDEKGVALWGIVRLRGELDGDRMCTKMLFGISGWRNLACKPSIPPEIDFPKPTCFVKYSALTTGNFHSQWVFPITSKVIEILTDTFNNVFFNKSPCQNGLTEFQNNMKDVVRLLLILYIIIFGFKLATGNERIGKRDFFMFILKFVLVVYFSVGTLDVTKPTTLDQSKNGLILLRNIAIDGMTSFSNMVMEAGVAQEKLCDFSHVNYTKGYSYLKMWDTLDCKIAFYLGLAQPTEIAFKAFETGVAVVGLAAGLFSLMWALISSFQILLLVFLFAFGIFLLSLVVYFTHLYIIAMIAVTIMIFFGPIFVPLALFDYTKEYFNKWLQTLFGYALQPVIVIAVISFMLLTFDNIVYSDCQFTQKTLSNSEKPYWTFNTPPQAQSNTCKQSLGYILANFTAGKYIEKTYKKIKGETVTDYDMAAPKENFIDILNALMLCTFFAFLFYYFADQIGSLAQELSGAPDLGAQAIGATATADLIANVATEGKAEEAKQAIKQADSGINVSTKTKEREGIAVHATEKSSGISALSKK